jgi:hypothetical protein
MNEHTHQIGITTPLVNCVKCQQRPGTDIWCDGTLAYVHGAYSMWCKSCVLDAQIAHAEKAAASLVDLRLALASLKSQGRTDEPLTSKLDARAHSEREREAAENWQP